MKEWFWDGPQAVVVVGGVMLAGGFTVQQGGG